MQVLGDTQRGSKINMHFLEGRHQILQKMSQTHRKQWSRPPSGKVIPNPKEAEERDQEQNSYPVADRKTPISGTYIGRYHLETVLVPRNIG